MDLSNLKITAADYDGKDVAGLPDSISGDADNVKARFDALVKDVVVPRLNALVDYLEKERNAYGTELPSTAEEGDSYDFIMEE